MADPLTYSLATDTQPQQEDESYLTSPAPDVAPQELAPLADKPQEEAPIYTGIDYAAKEAKRRKEVDVMARIGPDLKGETPELKPYQTQANALIDTKSAMDMTVNWRGTAAFMGMDVSELETSRYGEYKATIAGKLNRPVPKSEGEYRSMLTEHFTREKNKDVAADELFGNVVLKAFQDTGMGKNRAAMSLPTEYVKEWETKHKDLIAGDAGYHAQANSLYKQTLKDIESIRGKGAETFSALMDFTQGKADDTRIAEVAEHLSSSSKDERDKVYRYLGVAAEAGHIDRAGIEQFAINMGQSFTRGFDFIPQGTLQQQENAFREMRDTLATGKVWLKSESGTPTLNDIYRPSQGATGSAININLTGREATPEEVATLKAQAEGGLKTFGVIRELRNVAKSSIDPIRPVFNDSAIERGAYGLAGSLGIMVPVAINPMIGTLAYQAQEYDRIMLENPNINPTFAQGLALFEGAGNAALDRLQLGAINGKLPVFGGLLNGIKNNGIRRVLATVGFEVLEQNVQEAAQDLIAPLTETLAAALREDMPDKDFGALMKDYMGSRAETFFAVLPLALLGGGIGTYRDLKNPAMQMADRNLEIAGFGPTQRDYIAKATTPEEKAARIEQEWSKRKENDIKAGEKILEASIAEARTPQGDTIEVNTKADGVDEWIVRDPAGKEVARVASEQEAVTIKADRGSAEIRSQANVVADLLDSDWRKDKLPNFEAQFGGEVTPEQLLQDAEAKGDTKLVEAIKASIEVHGNDPAELAKLRVLGESRITPYAEGQYKALIKLNEGYTAQDAFEELTHSIFDIDIAEGRLTKEQARDWVSQTTSAGVANYKFSNDAEVRESMAQIAQDYARNKIDETNLPSSFVAFLKKLYTEFVEFMRRAKLLDQAFTEGKIDAEFERYLSEKIGLSDATMIEREVSRIEGEEGAMAFSIRSRDEAYDAAVKSGGIDAFKRKLQGAVDSLPDPIEDEVDFHYKKGGVEGLVEGFFMPAFRALGAFVDWHNASTGSQYITIKIPTENETYKDAVENGGDLEEHKITIRDHDVSPFRAKEFGSPTKVIQVDDFNTKGNVLHAATRLSDHLSDIIEPYRDYLAEKANSDAIADTGVAGIKTPTKGEADKSNIANEGQGNGSALTSRDFQRSSPDGKSFSIQSQEQIDRVNKAVADTTQFAEGRMALYERAKERFKAVLAENKDILDAIKEGGAAPEKIRRAKLIQGIAELEVILRQLPAEVRGKVGGFGVLARGGTGDTFLANFFRDRVRMIDEQLEKYLSKEYDEELYRVFERSKPKKDKPGEKPKGIGAEIQALFAELKEAQKWSPEKLETELAKLETELTQVEDAEAYGMDEVQAKAKEEARILQSINLLSKVGGWNPKYAEKVKADGKVSIVKVYNGKTSNEKADAIRALKAAWAKGYYEFQMKKIKEREDREAIQSNMKDSTNKAGTDAERIQKQLSEMGMAAGWGKSIYDLSSFDQVVNLIFGDNSEIANELSDIQRKTENQKEDALQRKYEEVEDLFTKLAGGSTLKGKQLQYDMMQPSIKFTEGAYKGIELSQMQAISDIMMWNQEDGKRHMEGRYDENGKPISKWHYTQEFIDYLEKSITKEGRAVMDFLLTKYAEEHPEINKVYKPLNGVSLISIENYAPLSVVPQQQKSGQMVDPTTGQSFSSASITPRSLLTRGTSIAQPDITVDAVQKYLSHTRQMEHWKAFAPVIAKYGTALRNRDVLDSIEAKAGKAGRTAITNWLDYMTNGGVREAGASLWTNKMANDVMGRAAQVALFGRVGTILLQGTQLAAASAVMPHGSYMVRLSKLLTGNLDWASAIKSDYIQRRIKQMPVVEQQAMQELATARPSRVIEIQRLLGASLSTADGFFTGGTFAMVYDYQLSQAKENGMTGKEAEDFALNEAERITDRIAQPTRPGARSMWELTATSPASRLAFSFASEPRKNLALLLYAKKTDGVFSARFWRAATYTIFLSGILSALARNAWKDMKDDSDDEWFDEKHWGWKRLSLMAITDPANGIPLVGSSIQEAALHLGGVYYQNDNLMSLNKGTSTARQLPKYWEGDWTADQVMRDVDTIFSVAGMANQNMAAYSSLSHLARDVFGVAKTAKKEVIGE